MLLFCQSKNHKLTSKWVVLIHFKRECMWIYWVHATSLSRYKRKWMTGPCSEKEQLKPTIHIDTWKCIRNSIRYIRPQSHTHTHARINKIRLLCFINVQFIAFPQRFWKRKKPLRTRNYKKLAFVNRFIFIFLLYCIFFCIYFVRSFDGVSFVSFCSVLIS